MISHLTGILLEKNPPIIIINVGGVGYEVHVSMQTFYALPPQNEPISLHTQFIVREDAQLLFGFSDREEKTTFQALLKVSGIGAKTALSILSVLNSHDLARAIAEDNISALSSVPGIGKKTAERMILELRDKLTPSTAILLTADAPMANLNDDVINTLMALGYSQREAVSATKNIGSTTDVGEGVKQALKYLVK